MKNPFMPLWVTDYVRGTRLFTLEQKGLYMDMLLELWIEGDLPSDTKVLAKLFSVHPRTFNKIWDVIRAKFELSDGRVTHERVTKELNKLKSKSGKARESANKRWNKDANALPTDMPSQCYSDTDTDTYLNKKKSIKKKFIPPTLTSCKEYFTKNGSTEIEGEKFFYFYESKGWKVGKEIMTLWRSAASGWIRRNAEKPTGAAKAGVPGKEKDYSNEKSGRL